MKRLLHIFLLTAVFAAMLVAPTHALEYTILDTFLLLWYLFHNETTKPPQRR